MWAHASVSAATHCALDRPKLAIRRNDMAHAMGPCEAMRTRGYRSLWANSTSSAGISPLRLRAHASILPRQPSLLVQIMRAHAPVSAAALYGPVLAVRYNDTAIGVGLCEAMCARGCKSPWANSTASATLNSLTFWAHA